MLHAAACQPNAARTAKSGGVSCSGSPSRATTGLLGSIELADDSSGIQPTACVFGKHRMPDRATIIRSFCLRRRPAATRTDQSFNNGLLRDLCLSSGDRIAAGDWLVLSTAHRPSAGFLLRLEMGLRLRLMSRYPGRKTLSNRFQR